MGALFGVPPRPDHGVAHGDDQSGADRMTLVHWLFGAVANGFKQHVRLHAEIAALVIAILFRLERHVTEPVRKCLKRHDARLFEHFADFLEHGGKRHRQGKHFLVHGQPFNRSRIALPGLK